MSDIAEAFTALSRLDEDGYKAVSLATQMLQEKLRVATARAERAEWLLCCLHKWAIVDWGLIGKAAARWDAERAQEPDSLTPLLDAHVTADLRDLRARLDEALDGREAAEMRVDELLAERNEAVAERSANG